MVVVVGGVGGTREETVTDGGVAVWVQIDCEAQENVG